MAYNETLARRLRSILSDESGVVEKKMFGGLAFLIHGNMSVGIVKDDLLVRVHPENHDEMVNRPHARIMDFTGRPMRGWIFVAPEGYRTATSLRKWVNVGLEYSRSLKNKK